MKKEVEGFEGHIFEEEEKGDGEEEWVSSRVREKVYLFHFRAVVA